MGKFKLVNFYHNFVVFQCSKETKNILQSGTRNAILGGSLHVVIMVPVVGIFEIPTVNLKHLTISLKCGAEFEIKSSHKKETEFCTSGA